MSLAKAEELREQIVAVSTLFWREEYNPGLKSAYKELLKQYAIEVQGLDGQLLSDAAWQCAEELGEQEALVSALEKLEVDAFADAVGRQTRLFDQLQILQEALECSPPEKPKQAQVTPEKPKQLPFL